MNWIPAFLALKSQALTTNKFHCILLNGHSSRILKQRNIMFLENNLMPNSLDWIPVFLALKP
jgi:hypothetical protein